MSSLFPPIKPYVTRLVDVQPPHQLYVEESGNRQGIPVLFVHGGPGSGCESYHRQFFDPAIYRIILFDQRGAGRSTPHASLEHNTTQALIEDMETLRKLLKIEQWLLFGGSWGSTLSLAYAEANPERVSGLILRGIFLCRPQEIAWFYQEGASRIFPDLWQDYLSVIPQNERENLVAAYYKRLTSDVESVRLEAARQWSIWEGRTATLLTRQSVVDHFSADHTAVSLARIECHYFMHDAFMKPNQLIENAHKLKHIPGIIIHGRYDMVCPIESAWALHKAWPEARLEIVPDAGHAASEPTIASALVKATNEMANLLK